ncbi:uncharacterized protein CANTADRAFT_102553 [Suhomyces tanzawaensis NRRL Y-17324]|uniref:Uncharacterized protein n=1 Tax=Suhomyces tanzawaensis NRRL Y-17324 TaxID=984487 RepID=A0A1E4SC49_9ASCO|nr:uncharacterized protein CANTADRAFT_102553 [Suhomyces tanzawaensis NRRL Y-17324]ODV76962.1 hypothetical protein CANTADRAFT_102553 [Suhomyces tanzawaensis NRRL Y-17324]
MSPSTALQRVMEKLSSISFTPSPLSGLSGSAPNHGKEPEAVVQSVLAQHLNNKIGKIIKLETRLIGLQRELSDDLASWGTTVRKPGCQLMVRELSGLYLDQTMFKQSVVDKLENIKLSLHSVNEREKKHKDLLYTRTKLTKQVKDSELRFGKNSSHSTLLSEKLEENTMNLEVLNSHCIRAIATEMRETVLEYTISLQQNLKFLLSSVAEYRQLLSTIDWDADIDASLKWVQMQRKSELNTPVAWPDDERNQKENEMEKERLLDAKIHSADIPACKLCKKNKYGKLITPCSHGQGLQFIRPQEVPQENW